MRYGLKFMVISISVGIAIYLNIFWLEPILIPDPCFYHTNELKGWKSFFYQITAISNGHPEPNWLNWLVTVLIGTITGRFFYKNVSRKLSFMLVVFLVISCNQSKNSNQIEMPDSELVEQNISEKNTKEFAVKLKWLEKQTEIKFKKPIVGDTITFFDHEIRIQILDKNQQVFHEWKIEKELFDDIISEEEMPFYQISICHLEATEELYWLFFVNICQPESDICYPIELKIFTNKTISWKEIEVSDEE